jgi:hypothetical protein
MSPAIRKTLVGVMATGTGHGIIRGQHGIEEQESPEVDLLGRESIPDRGQAGFQAADG